MALFQKLDHSGGLTFEGAVYNGRFGSVISSIGDINNDGFHGNHTKNITKHLIIMVTTDKLNI